MAMNMSKITVIIIGTHPVSSHIPNKVIIVVADNIVNNIDNINAFLIFFLNSNISLHPSFDFERNSNLFIIYHQFDRYARRINMNNINPVDTSPIFHLKRAGCLSHIEYFFIFINTRFIIDMTHNAIRASKNRLCLSIACFPYYCYSTEKNGKTCTKY